MRRYLMLLVLFPVTACQSAAARDARVERMIATSLVKIYVTANPPDYQSPWQRSGVMTSTGSGVIIQGNRILTAAHVVADHVSVEVKRAGATRRFQARVAHVGHACDLALLEVDDATFFDGAKALRLGELPRLRDRVEVFGFPEGGEKISVTAGIVSRIETGAYVHSGTHLLLAQVDAAINAGNSGGPVMSGARLAGIAAEALYGAENIGYMIPPPVIQHFLEDVKDGAFHGFPRLGIEVQPLDNEAHRRSLGLEGTDAGVRVRRINANAAAAGVLEVGDVLTKVGGVEVARDATVELRTGDRVHLSHVIAMRQVGDRLPVRVVREGVAHELAVTVSTLTPLVPGPRYDVMPTYLLLGGFVFQPLSAGYMDLFMSVPSDLDSYASYHNVVTAERREIIVLAQVLSHRSTQGFDELADLVVADIDGKAPRDMAEFARLLDAANGEWLRLQFETGQSVVLHRETVQSAQAAILADYDIGAARSADLRAQQP